ncbi:putative alpha/beta hydrolase family esterase [Thalassospira sp. MBR-102]|uniref:RBBP9/YdeN family alpha/beta hydrolase n=1 Tax=Thalassospira sp. MBR-102 TaxID=3156466 RepID=UPI003393F6A8
MEHAMKKLLLPGYKGSNAGHWQRIWSDIDPDAIIVNQDDWLKPRLKPWIEHVRFAVSKNPNAILIAHSLGCILVAHLARAFPDLPIAGALLVAPADVDRIGKTYPDLAGFAPIPIRKLPFPSIVVASRNDEYCDFTRARSLASAWGSELIDAGEAGHINIESGHGRWSDGFKLADRLVDLHYQQLAKQNMQQNSPNIETLYSV